MNDSGRYRIHVVSELTGVPAPTLRAWERRHGIPTPARTSSAYRLYSDRDVEMVRRLRDLCASGIAIAEAAKQVRATIEPPPPLETDESDPYAMAAQRILDAVTDFNPDSIEREVARAACLGSATVIFERVYAPTLRRVGDLWHQGALSVAQEHLVSGLITDTVRGFVRLLQPSGAARRVLLACFEHEEHVIGMYGVAMRLAAWGVRVIELGARTPPDALGDAIEKVRPDAVGLSITVTPTPVERARPLVEAYAAACGKTPWFVGGAAVRTVAPFVAAHGAMVIDGEIHDARPQIEQMLNLRSTPRG